MTIEKQPFRKYNLDGDKSKADSFTIWLNENQRNELEYWKATMQQPKDSTAIKEMCHSAFLNLIGDKEKLWILGRILRNSYNNRKTGAFVKSQIPAESDENPGENLTD